MLMPRDCPRHCEFRLGGEVGDVDGPSFERDAPGEAAAAGGEGHRPQRLIDPSTRSGGRRLKSAKARNRCHRRAWKGLLRVVVYTTRLLGR
jgi:hypothetical protein